MSKIDPITLGILWDRLISITDEVVSTLIRTSFSINVRESYDLSCVLFDAEGKPICQGSYSVPSFTGTSGPTMQHMLKRFPLETLEAGDIIATNDPWMGTGHLYDINVMRPVFLKGKRVGFTMSITHLPDIGGTGSSSVPGEIYEEGLRLPVCKLVRKGKLNEDVFDIIKANVRAQEQVIGDIMANISCNEAGGRLLQEFLQEYRIEDMSELSRMIRDQSERTMREGIRKIPDGRYENAVQIEGIDQPIGLKCTITKQGEEVEIDFTGTGGCVNGAINVPFCYTRAWAAYAIKCLVNSDTPNNEGQVRPIKVTAPEGCILNAQHPVATGGRHSVGHFVVPLIFGALRDALPNRVQADMGMMSMFNVQGQHRNGRPVASLYFLSGGFGAMEGTDGPAAMPGPSNMGVVPTEIWESMTSMTIERRTLRADSGGAGKYRGGLGQEAVLRNDTGHPMTVSFMGMRTQFPAVGYHGGEAGAARRYEINGKTVSPKGRYVLQPGDVVSVFEAGGGGFGPANERDPESTRTDVRKGFITAAEAKRKYNLVVTPGAR